MKCTAMIMLVCLMGTAAAAGYTSSQETFLLGESPVRGSMDDSRFEDYAEMYWASYISKPERAPMAPVLAGQMVDIENTMSFWRNNFPFDISKSTFGDGTARAASTTNPRYDFASIFTWRYISPMPIEESSFEEGDQTALRLVDKNREHLIQDVKKNFGL